MTQTPFLFFIPSLKPQVVCLPAPQEGLWHISEDKSTWEHLWAVGLPHAMLQPGVFRTASASLTPNPNN